MSKKILPHLLPRISWISVDMPLESEFTPFLALFRAAFGAILFDIYLLSKLFRMSGSLGKRPVSGRLGRFSSPATRR